MINDLIGPEPYTVRLQYDENSLPLTLYFTIGGILSVIFIIFSIFLELDQTYCFRVCLTKEEIKNNIFSYKDNRCISCRLIFLTVIFCVLYVSIGACYFYQILPDQIEHAYTKGNREINSVDITGYLCTVKTINSCHNTQTDPCYVVDKIMLNDTNLWKTFCDGGQYCCDYYKRGCQKQVDHIQTIIEKGYCHDVNITMMLTRLSDNVSGIYSLLSKCPMNNTICIDDLINKYDTRDNIYFAAWDFELQVDNIGYNKGYMFLMCLLGLLLCSVSIYIIVNLIQFCLRRETHTMQNIVPKLNPNCNMDFCGHNINCRCKYNPDCYHYDYKSVLNGLKKYTPNFNNEC